MGATTAPNPRLALTIVIVPYLLWVAATYLLEGRLLTFQRPEAPLSRLAHAVVTNILVGLGGSVIIESVLFGACHFAHSSPFNTARFVVLLGTLFFFVSRDVYGTIVFYNFLGIFGVVGALEPPSTLGSFEQRAIPLLAMAVVAVVLLVVAHACVVPGTHLRAPR